MTCKRFSQYSKGVAVCLIYLLLTLIPVIYLSLSGTGDDAGIINARRAGLIVNSLIIAFFTVMICLVIAVFVSLRIYDGLRKRPVLRWYFLLLSPVPPYIYALTYMNLLRFLGRFFPSLLQYRMTGIVPCVTVECFVYLPFACAVALTALEQVNVSEWKAALLFEDADSVFYKIIIPKQLPWLLAAGAVIFALSVTDYSIPSLFQVNVYAMEIFSDYSSAGQSVHSLRLSLPLILISACFIVSSFIPLKNASNIMKEGEDPHPSYSPVLRRIGNIAVIVSLMQIILPLFSFIPYLMTPRTEFVSAAVELWNSCLSGAAAVVILIIPSAAMALFLAGDSRLCRPLIWMVAILPLCIPGTLTGIGVLKMISSTQLYVIRSGVMMSAVGLAVRYMPFATLIQYGCYLRIDRARILAAGLLQNRRGRAFFRVKLPLMAPGLVVSSLVVFLLTLGDVGVSLILMSPGREPMSVKIYNYLHYGSSETVTVFCLIQIIVCIVLMAAVYLTYSLLLRGKRYQR